MEATKAVLAGAASIRANPRSRGATRENTLAVMDFVLSNTLRLFHPFLPFITEELWHGMGFNEDLPAGPRRRHDHVRALAEAVRRRTFKDIYALDDCYIERVENKYELVRQGRNLRREARIAANVKVRFVLKPMNDLPPHDIAVLKILLNAEQFEVNHGFEPTKGTARALTPLGELFLPLEGLIDLGAERARLQKELDKIRTEIEKVSQKLSNPASARKFRRRSSPNISNDWPTGTPSTRRYWRRWMHWGRAEVTRRTTLLGARLCR